jgi:large subunit ribosomal protein L4
MKIEIKNISGVPTGEHEVGFEIITDNKGNQAVHDHVVAIRAGARRGTACTKTMGEVAGSGKKPWRQKGTGRARAGSFASPLWRGGGVTHGPKPRDYSKKVNQKVRLLAFRRALSERIRGGDVIVLDNLVVSAPKTQEFIKLMQTLGVNKTGLFVVDVLDKNVGLASRNIPGVEIRTGLNINTYDVLKYRKLIFTKNGFQQIEARLAKKVRN